MTEHAGVVRITTFPTDENRRARLVESLLRVSEEVRAAEGCFGAQVCSVEDRPDAVAAVSRWRSRGDLDAYLAAHGADIESAVAGMLSGTPETDHFTSLSPH